MVLSGVGFSKRTVVDAAKALVCAWGRHPRIATMIALAGLVIGTGAAVASIGVRSAPAAVQEVTEADVPPLARQDSLLVRMFDWSRFPTIEADAEIGLASAAAQRAARDVCATGARRAAADAGHHRTQIQEGWA